MKLNLLSALFYLVTCESVSTLLYIYVSNIRLL